MNQIIGKFASKAFLVVAIFAYLCLSTGGFDTTVRLYGNVQQTDLTDFNQIFKDSGGLTGSGDAGWHLRVAQELASKDLVSPDSLWWLASAPPGLGVTEGLILKYFGSSAFGLAYILFLCALWTLAFTLILGFGLTSLDLVKRLFVFVMILEFTGFSQWMIGPGLFYTEALSIPLMVICFALCLRALDCYNHIDRSLLYGTAAVFLASASFVRANFLYISYLLILLAIFNKLGASTRLKRLTSKTREDLRENARLYSAIGIGALVALLPYFFLAKNYIKLPFGSLNSTGFHLQYAWINPEENMFRSIGAGWLCEINSKYCQDQMLATFSLKQVAMQNLDTLLKFPLEILSARADVFSRGWFSGENPGATGNYDAIPQGIVLICLIVWIVLTYFRTVNSKLKGETRVFLIFLVANILPYSITHVEVRFLIPAKIIVILFFARTIVLNYSDHPRTNLKSLSKTHKKRASKSPSDGDAD